jgi:putative hydrolase of the HAD superfamily
VETFPEIVFYEGAALSYDLGVMKPTAEFFAEALRRFDIDPSHAVFIDDLEENVEGAIRVGINGIVYKGRAQLVRDLRKIDVMVPDGME